MGLPREYSFDELISKQEDAEKATKESFSVEVTEEMMDMFMKISGDENPLHADKGFACEKGFKDRVVYGMLTASFYSRLAGMYIPGKNCILHKVESSFRSPVFVGDVLTVEGVVNEKNESVRQIEISAKIVNQDGKKVGKAKILAGVME